jgi:ADP-ribosyl-[dinitrogen reductase] hydrolase
LRIAEHGNLDGAMTAMLVEIAIGDAYGAGFEYAANRFVRERNDLSGYVQHPRHGTKPGCYTDDTQMSIAIAEALVAGDSWTTLSLASRFVGAFKRDPREGYAGAFFDFLQEVQDGEDFLARIRPQSEKSGAAMRSCPIGVLASIEDVVKKARFQAAITHDTPGGTNAAIATAVMTHYCTYQLGPKSRLPEYLAALVPGPWHEPWEGKVGHEGMASVRAALTSIVMSSSLTQLLRSCVAYTGDVDTVAAIALGAASHCDEIASDLPVQLYDGLERGPYGIDYLSELDRSLMAFAGGR